MALVVLLRGVNIGGHRTFRPSVLARRLRHLGAVNIGAAGTFVIREPASRAELHREFSTGLPFAAEIVICRGREIVNLVSRDPFSRYRHRSDVVRFVSVLCRRPVLTPALPIHMPARGRWLLNVLARDGRFVLGMYRRDMRVIGYLGALDRMFGAPVTSRNWNTMTTIAKIVNERAI